jgi:hypothetical protein
LRQVGDDWHPHAWKNLICGLYKRPQKEDRQGMREKMSFEHCALCRSVGECSRRQFDVHGKGKGAVAFCLPLSIRF